MTLRDFLSPNPRLTRGEYALAVAMGRKRYAGRGALKMARWLATLSVVILIVRGYLAGDWARMLNLRVAFEVALLVAACSAFAAYTTYTLIWKALHQMFGPKSGP